MCFDSAHFRQNQDQSLVTLFPDSVAAPIKLQAFTSVVVVVGRGGEDPDRKLCPVRALPHYRKVTSNQDLQKGRRRLFVSYELAKTDESKRDFIINTYHVNKSTIPPASPL